MTYTTKYQVTRETWVNLGAMPLFIQVIGPSFLHYVFATETPTDLETDSHILYKNSDKILDLGFITGNIYVKSGTDIPVTVVVSNVNGVDE